MGKDLEGNGSDLIELLLRNLPGGTEEHLAEAGAGYVFQSRLEPNNSRIRV
jgi:hypothetical protein